MAEDDQGEASLLRARIKELETQLSNTQAELAAANQKWDLSAALNQKKLEDDQRKNAEQEQIFFLQIELDKAETEAAKLREKVRELFDSRPKPDQMVVRPNMPSHPLGALDKVGFLMMPFGLRWSPPLEAAVQNAFEQCKLVYKRADRLVGRHIMLDIIWKSICECGIVVADITGCNPNVLYELGLADAIGKRIILISQTADPKKLAFDLLGLQIIVYSKTKSGLEDLTAKLVEALKTSNMPQPCAAAAKAP